VAIELLNRALCFCLGGHCHKRESARTARFLIACVVEIFHCSKSLKKGAHGFFCRFETDIRDKQLIWLHLTDFPNRLSTRSVFSTIEFQTAPDSPANDSPSEQDS